MSHSLYYWYACSKFWGRAIGIVLTLDEAGAEYTMHPPEDAPSDIGFAVPMLTLDSGQTLSQTIAILHTLGEQYHLNGKTIEEQRACLQTLHDIDDIFNEALTGKMTENPERANQWFALLEKKLAHHSFLVSNTPTTADFHAVFAFEWVNKSYSASGYEAFPRVMQWWKDIGEHPSVKKMKTSGIPMIP